MRCNKDIRALEHSAMKIDFPKADDNFDRFFHVLERVIEDNCDHPTSLTLEYMDDQQKFFVIVRATGRPGGIYADTPAPQFSMKLETVCSINPQEPLTPQIEAINKAQDEVNKTHQLLSELFFLHRKGYKMVDTESTEWS